MNQTEQQLAELQNRIKQHDYTYEMSDDFRCWKTGSKDEEEIRKLICKFKLEHPLLVDVLKTCIKDNYTKYGTNFMTELE